MWRINHAIRHLTHWRSVGGHCLPKQKYAASKLKPTLKYGKLVHGSEAVLLSCLMEAVGKLVEQNMKDVKEVD